MREHKLKCNRIQFMQTWLGFKTFEIRKNDRDYRQGDIVSLLEWDPGDPDPESIDYTGRGMDFVIGHIVAGEYGLAKDVCVFQIHSVTREEIKKLRGKNRKKNDKNKD